MKQLKVIQPLETKGEPDLASDIHNELIKNMPEDMRVAMAAGCRVDVHVFKNSDGYKIQVKTVNPISILKDKETGKVISIYEKRPGGQSGYGRVMPVQ